MALPCWRQRRVFFGGWETLTAAGLPRESGSGLPQSMFWEASLLGVEGSRVMFRDGAFALATAEGVLRQPGDSGGSRAASGKRQQAAAVHVVHVSYGRGGFVDHDSLCLTGLRRFVHPALHDD